MNKKIIIITSIIVVAITATITGVLLLKDKKETPPIEKTLELNKTTILEKPNAVEATKLIKSNIVKITNDTGKGTITGTGFFHESGYLITNSHVVDIKGTIKVTYSNGKETQATIVSNDITSDIAILSVENPNVLALTLGNTLELNVTDELYAIGYPLALEGEATVTKGILSARRSAGGIEYLQTDAAINSGNSGGPIINAKAEVYGMITYASDNASLGMSISSESLTNIINKLLENKKVNYIDKERPTNALSTVLKEVGHKCDDLYNERDLLDKIHGIERPKEEEKEPVKPVKKSNDARIKKLVVNGKTYNLGAANTTEDPHYVIYDNSTIYLSVRRGDMQPLKIEVTPMDPKATVKIEDNKLVKAGYSGITNIFVISEDGKRKTNICIKKSTTIGYMERLAGVTVYGQVIYHQTKKENVLGLYIGGMDSDGLDLAGTSDKSEDPFTYANLSIYTGEGEDKRLIKQMRIPCDKDTWTGYPTIMTMKELRTLLTDEDYKYYDDNQAIVTLEGTIETFKQGTFKFQPSSLSLKKSQ